MDSINGFLDQHFARIWRDLVRSVRKRCPWLTWAQAEEVAQATLLKLLTFDDRMLAGLSEEDATKLIFAYLYRCLKAQIGDEGRAYKRKQSAEAIPQWEGPGHRFTQEQVRAALLRLPEASRELLEQIYYDGKSKEEILIELNAHANRMITRRALQARVDRALDMLRRELTLPRG